jgi:hypothetical protein
MVDPTKTGLTTVRSADELGKVATSEVNADIAGQVAPLQSQYDVLGGQQDRTRDAITSMFGNIMPYVQGAAGAVKTAYDEAETRQSSIFKQAQIRLNSLKQSRAQEAQALAQEIGGPVALSEFTAGMDDNAQALANLGAGAQLHTLGYAAADVGQANAFAGRVFPLIQTEEQSKARAYFEDQKKDLQKQITALEATKGSKATTRKNELITAERTYALQQTQSQLDKLKADRDWKATKRTLKNDDARLAIAQEQQRIQQGQLTGTYDGKPTLGQQSLDQQAKALSVREQQFAQQLGMTKQEFALRKSQLQSSTKLAQQRMDLAQAQSASQYLDAALTPQYGKTVITTTPAEIDQTAAFHDKGAWKVKGKDGKDHYYHMIKSQYTPQLTAPITNPNLLVDYLTAHNVPRAHAISMVKQRLNLPNWKYGQDPEKTAAKAALQASIAAENKRRKK